MTESQEFALKLIRENEGETFVVLRRITGRDLGRGFGRVLGYLERMKLIERRGKRDAATFHTTYEGKTFPMKYENPTYDTDRDHAKGAHRSARAGYNFRSTKRMYHG